MEINPNSQQPTGSSLPTSALGNIQRPGEYLRQIRVSQKKELEQVSSDLNMPLKTLSALEQDDYKSLPEATFIKGYYRSYAKYLNVDASEIIQRFDEIYENDTGLLSSHALNDSPIKLMGKLPGSTGSRNKKWLKRTTIIVVVLVVILLLVLGVQKWSSNKDKNVDAQVQSNDIQILPMNDGASTAQGDELVLSFSHPTSIHIVDGTGKVLSTGRKSEAITLHGNSPFQIRLDDASGVSLSLNNEQISLSPYTVNGKAEFRLSR